MRTLLIMIGLCSLLIVGVSLVGYWAGRAEQIDMKSELSHFQATAQPPSDALLANHSARIGRLGRHWGFVGILAGASMLASVVCLGLGRKKRGSNEG